jgi:hypothetical protein
MVQNYHRDAAGHLRWCTGEKEGGHGLPFSSRVVVSLYDTSARYARHGHIISWKGFSAHLTETCAPDGPDVITHVLARPLPDLLTHRGPADRGQAAQVVPAQQLDGVAVGVGADTHLKLLAEGPNHRP